MSAYKLRKPPILSMHARQASPRSNLLWAALAIALTIAVFLAARPPTPAPAPLLTGLGGADVSMAAGSPRMSLSTRLHSLDEGATHPAGARGSSAHWWRSLPTRLFVVLAAVATAFTLGWRSRKPDGPARTSGRRTAFRSPAQSRRSATAVKGAPAPTPSAGPATASAQAQKVDSQHSARLQDLLREKTSLITELEARFSAHREEQAELRQRAEAMEAESARALELDAQLEQGVQECLILREQIEEQDAHCHSLETQIAERDEHLFEMQDQAQEELRARDRITLELDARTVALEAAESRALSVEDALATRSRALAGLETRVTERDATISELSMQLGAANDELTAERDAADQQQAEMCSDNLRLHTALDTLREDHLQVQLLFDASRNELEFLRDGQTMREENLCKLSAEHEALQARHRRCHVEREDLALAVDERDQRIAGLEYDLVAQEPALAQARSANDALRLQLRNTRRAVAGLDDRLDERARQLAEQRTRIEGLEQTLSETRAECVALAGQIESDNRRSTAQQLGLRALDGRVEAASMHISVLQSALRAAGKHRCEQESALRALTDRLDSSLASTEVVREDRRRQESTLAAQQVRIRNLESALEEMPPLKANLAQARDAAAGAQGEVAVLRRDLRAASADRSAQREAIERANARTNAVAAELQTKCEALAGFEQRIAERAATIARLTTDNSNRDAKIRVAREQIESMREAISTQESELVESRAGLRASKKHSASLEAGLLEVQDALEELREARDELAHRMTESTEIVARKAAAIAGLEERLARREEQLDRQQNHEQELETELALRAESLAALERNLQARDKELETRASEIRALERQRRKLHEEQERLSGELERQADVLVARDGHIAQLDAQLGSKTADIATLESELFAATRAETVRIRELLSLIDEKSETLAAAASG